MKNIIIIAVIAGIFMAAMGGGFYMLWSKISALEEKAQAETEDGENAEGEADTGPRPIYKLTTMIVNLADEGGRRYLRATIDLEIRKIEDETRIEERVAQIKDAVLQIMSTRTFESINSIEGKTALKEEILARLNEFFKEELVTNIYFTEFVVQ